MQKISTSGLAARAAVVLQVVVEGGVVEFEVVVLGPRLV